MSLSRPSTLLRYLRPLAQPTTRPPHLPLPPSSRPLSSHAPLRASYRRFGDPPRSTSGPQRPPREAESDQDPLNVLLSRRQQGQRGAESATPGHDPLSILLSRLPQGQRGRSDSGYGRRGGRGGFSMHNAKALMQSPLFLVAVGGGGTYYVLHLEQVPETGRYRFMDVSPEMEKQMGDETLQQVLAECGGKILPDYHPQARHVQSVVKRIVQANGLEGSLGGKGFVTHVVKENQTKNAFVLPNGHIFVFTGILEVAQDSDGLAVVLGHEIAHQVARHSAERMSGTKVFYGLSLILGSLGVDFGVSRILLNLVMQLPNSRKNETEADLIGLRLANAACYDPRAAESLWQRMGAAEQAPGVDMSFLSTHPSSKNRTVKVREWAEEIIKDRPSECGPLRGQASAFQGLTGSRW